MEYLSFKKNHQFITRCSIAVQIAVRGVVSCPAKRVCDIVMSHLGIIATGITFVPDFLRPQKKVCTILLDSLWEATCAKNQGKQIGIASRYIKSWQGQSKFVISIGTSIDKYAWSFSLHHGLIVCVSRLSYSRTSEVEQKHTENLKKHPGQTMSTTLVRMRFDLHMIDW